MRKKTQEQVLRDLESSIHAKDCDYSLVDYKNNHTPIKIICKIDDHGIFEQSYKSHYLLGCGCPKCAIQERVKTQEQAIEDLESVNDGSCSYSKFVYINNHSLGIIICLINNHGPFEQSYSKHYSMGRGCPKCAGNELKTHEQCLIDFKSVHGEIFDYSLVIYINTKTLVKIICKIHGIFEQTPHSHFIAGSGCPNCSSNISKGETEWKDMLGIPKENRNLRLIMKSGKTYNVDGYDLITKTCWEYYGDDYHGNPNSTKFKQTDFHWKRKDKTFGELYQATLVREQELLTNGYTIVWIWESDFLAQQKLIKKGLLDPKDLKMNYLFPNNFE